MDTVPVVIRFIWYAVWTALCVQLLIWISTPVGLIALVVGVATGAVIGLVHTAAVLTGRTADTEVLSPSAVALGRFPGRVRPEHIRRDRAWPHYLTSQVRLDVISIIRSGGKSVGTAWAASIGALGTQTRRKIFYLWPALIIVAAALAGLTAGTAAVMVIVTVIAVLLKTIGWGLGLTTMAFLRGIDRSWQAIFRASGSCPRCYAVTQLPAYRCSGEHLPYEKLHGDDLHRDIRPGKLGVLWRRCTCGRRLPTTVLRASRRLDACCPMCTEPMHAGAAVATDVRIPVFGAASSGKTHFIVSAMVSLLEPDAGSATAKLVDEYSKRKHQEFVAFLDNDGAIPKTDAASPPIAVTVQLGEGRRTALLHLFDAAGEALADPGVNDAYSYLDRARTLLFVLDPFSIPDIRDQFATSCAEAFKAANPAQTIPEASYQATVNRLRRSGVATERQKLAFVVSKRDLLAGLPLATPLPTASPEIRTWLVHHNLDNLVLSAERDFAGVRFFAISSRDRSADGPIAPIQWLLETDHFTLRPGLGKSVVAQRSGEPEPVRPPLIEVEHS